MRLQITLLGLMLGLSLTQAAQAENVYKWVDKDGKVHFGDRPQAEEAEELKVTDKSAPVRASSRYNRVDDEADLDEASPGANLMADASDTAPQGSFDAKQLVGRWQDDMMDDAIDTFAADGSYTRNASIFGASITLKGSWKLVGDQLHIQINSESMALPNGKTKTEAKSQSRKCKLLSLSGSEMTVLQNTKGGEMEFTMKRVGG